LSSSRPADQLSAVAACQRVWANVTATAPLHLYERLGADGRERSGLLEDFMAEPNPELTEFDLRRVFGYQLGSHGNYYGEIVKRDGRPRELWPIPPNRVTLERDRNGQLWYKVVIDRKGRSEGRLLHPSEILHVPGVGGGLQGVSPLRLARLTVDAGLAAEDYGRAFFSNGGRLNPVILHSGRLKDDPAADRLKNSVETWTRGMNYAGRALLLEEGVKLDSLQVNPQDAQFLESRRYTVIDICRFFAVPAFMLEEGDKQLTYDNGELRELGWYKLVVLSLWKSIEARWDRAFLLPSERRRYFFEHLAEGLLRADAKTRAEIYSTHMRAGTITPNEIRQRENLPKIPGGYGDAFQVPLATALVFPDGKIEVPARQQRSSP
jgi:HK97 family phage portal protein